MSTEQRRHEDRVRKLQWALAMGATGMNKLRSGDLSGAQRQLAETVEMCQRICHDDMQQIASENPELLADFLSGGKQYALVD